MIGFNELGVKGNFGNQLFQYCALRGVAEKKGYTWKIPQDDYSRKHDLAIHRAFNLQLPEENLGLVPYETFSFPNSPTGETTGFEFDERVLEEFPDDANLNGFFQSPKYFNHIESSLRSELTLSSPYMEMSNELSSTLGAYIAVHVRRGDYLRYPSHHPVMPTSYYREALYRLPPLPVVVVTNDANWCASQTVFKGSRIVSSKDYLQDFGVFIGATHIVIANSTFSWWGAWLSGADRIIAPKAWFGPALRHQSIRDLFPLDWWKI